MSKTPEQFMEYFRRNYPGPDTIIHKPDWHAPKIYAAAIVTSAHDDLLTACRLMVAHFESICDDRKDGPILDLARKAIAKAEGK
jgi:hypothetical protein